MFNPKRLVTVLSTALTLGVGAVLVVSATAPGSTLLRNIANNVTTTAHAAGGGGGGSGVITVSINSTGSLVGKLGAGVSVSYTCQPVFDPTFGTPIINLSSNLFVQVEQRQGKVIAHGSGFTSGNAICDNVTVNHATVVAVPDLYPGFTSPPFKKGVALATVNAFACATSTVTSPPFIPCDFGNAGPAAVSLK
jgi:hypothetical protein